MTTVQNDEAGSAAKPKPKPSRARTLIALVLLVGILSALAVEVYARLRFTKATETVDRLMTQKAEVSQAEIESAIGKKADGPPVLSGAEQQVTYTWRGLRPHVLSLFFVQVKGRKDYLVRVETP